MWRLTGRMVRSTLVTAWRLAPSPTSTSPFLENATTDGVVRPPSAFAMMLGSPPSRAEPAELVVPRAIPTARAMGDSLKIWVKIVVLLAGLVNRSSLNLHPVGRDCQHRTRKSCVHQTQLRAAGDLFPPPPPGTRDPDVRRRCFGRAR